MKKIGAAAAPRPGRLYFWCSSQWGYNSFFYGLAKIHEVALDTTLDNAT